MYYIRNRLDGELLIKGSKKKIIDLLKLGYDISKWKVIIAIRKNYILINNAIYSISESKEEVKVVVEYPNVLYKNKIYYFNNRRLAANFMSVNVTTFREWVLFNGKKLFKNEYRCMVGNGKYPEMFVKTPVVNIKNLETGEIENFDADSIAATRLTIDPYGLRLNLLNNAQPLYYLHLLVKKEECEWKEFPTPLGYDNLKMKGKPLIIITKVDKTIAVFLDVPTAARVLDITTNKLRNIKCNNYNKFWEVYAYIDFMKYRPNIEKKMRKHLLQRAKKNDFNFYKY